MKLDLWREAASLLQLSEIEPKCLGVAHLHHEALHSVLWLDPAAEIPDVQYPGRPPRPVLVEPAAVPRRRLGSLAGRIALVHAIAHIEFNAINLALDAVCRFRDMPEAYYLDWLGVAADEARHFQLLNGRLRDLGSEYGELPAHNGLWEMAQRTADSPLVRMALVPRVLEARGLDVTPGMIERLSQVGDVATVALLEVILREEIEHVRIGSQWFEWCCSREGREPHSTFMALLEQRYSGQVRGPFNHAARLRAGFTADELQELEWPAATAGR